MSRWRVVLAVLAVLLAISSLYVGPLLAASSAKQAAESGTAAAISSAEAKQNTQQTQKAIESLNRTEQGVDQLLKFVASVQSGDQAGRSAAISRWYVQEFQAICAAVGCRQVPPPVGLP